MAESLTRVEVPGNRIAERVVDLATSATCRRSLCSKGRRTNGWRSQAGMPLYPACLRPRRADRRLAGGVLSTAAMPRRDPHRLGRLQSDRFDDWHDEEPGRIPYPGARGPLARLDINPYAAYYADFASPLMFVIALAHLFAWTGDKARPERHWDTARRILDWAREHGDRDGDGYLEYLTQSPQGHQEPGLEGQRRRHPRTTTAAGAAADRAPASSRATGSPPSSSWRVLAWCLRRARTTPRPIGRRRTDLKERFNRDWWVEDERFVALALDPDKRLVRSDRPRTPATAWPPGSSTTSTCRRVVGRLFAPDMFSGWGVRTLSTEHPSYNPLSYHLGRSGRSRTRRSRFGLRRFGFDVRAAGPGAALFDLARLYPELPHPGVRRRLRARGAPHARAPTRGPTRRSPGTPAPSRCSSTRCSACSRWRRSTCWSSIRCSRPGCRRSSSTTCGSAGPTATLRCWRDDDGNSHAEILHKHGTLRLVQQPPPESLTAGRRAIALCALVDGRCMLHH